MLFRSLGHALKGKRDGVHIATKAADSQLGKDWDAADKHIAGQLERLQTDYIDFYLLHCIMDHNWELFQKFDAVGWLEKQKKAGVIRHYGFSYHGTPDFFQKVIKEAPWELTQIQHNYVDREHQAGEQGLMAADAAGLGTIIMGPCRGGQLAEQIHSDMVARLRAVNTQRSLADWAFSYLMNRPDVDICLSGMYTMEQLQENLAIADRVGRQPLTEEEHLALKEVGDIYRKLMKTPCNGCCYCQPKCKKGVNISGAMHHYNFAATLEYEGGARQYAQLRDNVLTCTECGACSTVCPQRIDIPAKLKEMEKYFSEG